MRYRSVALLGLLTTVLLTNIASAQLFRRLWERRKQELRSELSYDLQAKLNKDVDREVAKVREELLQSAKRQIASESEKLRAQVKAEIVALRKQAADVVAAEAEKLRKMTAAQVAEMKKAASQQIAAASTTLQKQVQTAAVRLNEQFTKGSQQLRKDLDTRWKSLARSVNDEVSKQVARQLAELPAKKKPEPDKKTSTPLKDLKAIETKAPEVTTEKAR